MSLPLARRVLIANRGEIALRILRSCRSAGLEAVAVYTEHDRDAPHVIEADAARLLPSYLDGPALVAAALASGCEAVHPGYGFLAENADFACAVRAAGLVFVGPSEAALRTMGSKTEARAAMAAAGVPVVPGSPVLGPGELAAAAAALGFPVLLKAVAGGGGKGMVRVDAPAGLARAAELASEQAEQAFGDGAIYLEKLIERPRHVEVQLFGDTHGNLVSLGERECSIQRRHQKIVEESPSPAVDPALRARLAEAAVAAGRAVAYEGAGTIEFLLAPDGSFYFLEMNTRLQVEHPVTEWVTGLDLVRLQLEVAAGRALPEAALAPSSRGHAIEVRIYAEDPAAGHLPQAGRLLLVREPSGPGLRVDSALAQGAEIGVHYDPLLAKLSAWGRDREEARQRLLEALRRFVILGVTTNIDQLQDVLAHEAFAAGDTTTAFLEEKLPGWTGSAPSELALAATALPVRSAASGGAAGRSASAWPDPFRASGRGRGGGVA